VKSRSIDVAQSPQKVFAEVKEALSEEFKILDHRILAPFQKDHAVFLNRKL
jgi:fibrillarin-like pre-rRNA processing protein